jgi:transposase
MLSCTFRAKEEDVAMNVTDEQWAVLEPLIPEPPRSRHGRGRLWRYAREALNCVLWVLRTEAP